MNLAIGNNTMSSREIAELTGKQLSHIHRDFKTMMNDLGVTESGVLTINGASSKYGSAFDYELDAQGRISLINLNQELTLTLVSGYSAKLRNAIIKRWQELESAVQAPAALPGNYIEALQALIESEKEKSAAKEQLQLAAPKIEFHDSIVNDSQTFSTRDAAKKIQQRPIKFGEWLKGNGYLCLNGRAAQKYIDMGLFVTHTGLTPSGGTYTQTRMTGKGCAYFNNKLFEVKL